MGLNAQATGRAGVAIGNDAKAWGFRSTAIGRSCKSAADYSLTLGRGADDGGNSAVVLSASQNGYTANAAGFFVKPVRAISGTANVRYNSASGEFTYDSSITRRLLTASEEADIEDVQEAEAARVWDLRPVSYRALEAGPGEHKLYGFIAEEVAKIDPRLVDWGEDAATGEPRVQGVDYEQVRGAVGPRGLRLCGSLCVCDSSALADRGRLVYTIFTLQVVPLLLQQTKALKRRTRRRSAPSRRSTRRA